MTRTVPVRAPLNEKVLRALSDPLRMRIVQLLAVEQLCTSHLVELTGAAQTNISNHLRALREAGLVTNEPCGRYSYHRLNPDRLAALGEQLTALAAAAQGLDTRKKPCG